MVWIIAFCFITSISRSEKYITGNAVYRVNNNKFQKLTYKGFIRTEENLVSSFQLEIIVLMVGHYVYEGNKEYVSIKITWFSYIFLINTFIIILFNKACLNTNNGLVWWRFQ